MANILEDTINFSVGLFAYSREKIESMVEKMVEKGEVARADAQSFASDLIKKGDEQRSELKEMIHKEVSEAMNACCGVTKEDIRAIIAEELAKSNGAPTAEVVVEHEAE